MHKRQSILGLLENLSARTFDATFIDPCHDDFKPEDSRKNMKFCGQTLMRDFD